jgi:sugar porter (SP) family MFS transporter
MSNVTDAEPSMVEPQIASAQMLRVNQAENRWRTLFASKTFIFWAFYSFMSLIVLGFDLTIPGQVLAMPAFNKQFGYNFKGTYVTRALYQSLWNGMTAIAQCIGALCSSWICNRFGRRVSYTFSSTICIIGIAIQFASRGWQLMMVGKAINGFGLGGCFCFGPLYVGENCFPELRGFYLVFLNSSIVYGQLFLALSARWSQMLPGNASWLTLLGMQWIFPVLTIALMPWYPESPYWILSKFDDLPRAKKELTKLYGSKNTGLIERRLTELQVEVVVMRNFAQKVTVWDCFRGSNWSRTCLTFLCGSTQQVIGTSFIFGYIGYWASLIGIKNPFDISIGVFVLGFAGNSIAFYTIERIGRRPLIVHGLLLMWVLLFLIGGLGFAATNNGALSAVTAFLFIWAFIYQTTLGAGALAFSSEISDLSLRAYTQPLVTIGNAGVGWIFGFVCPYMINPDEGNLGARVGLLFGFFGILSWVYVYFYVPETKDLSYTELSWLFDTKQNRRHFPEAIAKHRAEMDAAGIREMTGDDGLEKMTEVVHTEGV